MGGVGGEGLFCFVFFQGREGGGMQLQIERLLSVEVNKTTDDVDLEVLFE